MIGRGSPPATTATRVRSLLWAPDATEAAVATLVDAARERMDTADRLMLLPPALRPFQLNTCTGAELSGWRVLDCLFTFYLF